MDATRELTLEIATLPATDPRAVERQKEHLLDALKTALETPGEHRLFRWGKLPGLFAGRVGAAAAAATTAVRECYLETTRTEAKGRLVVEWVRATPKALVYVHEHDSPKATLRELKEVLDLTREGVPAWMDAARLETAQLALQFEQRAAAMLDRLDTLAQRVEAALRRAEATGVNPSLKRIVPWGVALLEYLDRRRESVPGPVPLPDLFRALEMMVPDLTLPQFQDGLRRLHDIKALRLIPLRNVDEPEYVFVVDKQTVAAVTRDF
jgi:hypothetical protein